jgi:hypothetical protein
MTITIGEVWTFKLTSGEELVGKATAVENNIVELQDPLSVAPGPQGLGLIQSMFTADPKDPAKLNMNNVTIFALTGESVKAKYIEAITGIIIPDKSIIMG